MPQNYYKVKGYDSRNSIGYLLRRGSKLVTAAIDSVFAKEELTSVQWIILMNLRDGLAKTSAELCDRLCHDSGALTRIIDNLEQRGMVERTRSTQDRRVVELATTKKGKQVVDSYIPRMVELYNSLMEDFTKEEADMMLSLLGKLTLKIAEHTGIARD